jgi:hypothetical protein
MRTQSTIMPSRSRRLTLCDWRSEEWLRFLRLLLCTLCSLELLRGTSPSSHLPCPPLTFHLFFLLQSKAQCAGHQLRQIMQLNFLSCYKSRER